MTQKKKLRLSLYVCIYTPITSDFEETGMHGALLGIVLIGFSLITSIDTLRFS